jgi:hypothetical protein
VRRPGRRANVTPAPTTAIAAVSSIPTPIASTNAFEVVAITASPILGGSWAATATAPPIDSLATECASGGSAGSSPSSRDE